MRAHHVHVEHDFVSPVDAIFAFLSEHEHLTSIFPVRIERVRDGDDGHRNGVGSCRRLSFNGLLPFEETVTEFVPDERIAYRITKGTPLRGHRGELAFSASPAGGTHLEYRIRIASPLPGVAPVVARTLRRSIARGLGRVDLLV